jgi:Lon protease-like protein
MRRESERPVIAPIFPLPNVVFFPHTFLPLHVFEPRYRRMVEDALAGDRLIAMVLAREERPPTAWPDVHALGALGRIEVAEPLPEGRYNIVLKGLVRVELARLDPRPVDPRDPARYFAAELMARGEALPDLQDPRVAEAKTALLMTARRYGELILEGRYPIEPFTDATPYVALVNHAATILRAGIGEKQSLLMVDDVGERAERVERGMKAQLDAQSAVESFLVRRPDNPLRN